MAPHVCWHRETRVMMERLAGPQEGRAWSGELGVTGEAGGSCSGSGRKQRMEERKRREGERKNKKKFKR